MGWRGIGVARASVNVFVRRNFAFNDELLKHPEDLDISFEGFGMASLGLRENCGVLLLILLCCRASRQAFDSR